LDRKIVEARGPVSAAAADDEFPMPVRRFLAQAELYLQRGDIVLCKGHASLYSWAIRWWTGSAFSHAAMVFSVPSHEEGFERTFLIEAGTSGVDLTDLKHYALDLSGVYDIAIKRCERDWLTVEVQRVIRGHMLNFIKANYDYFKIVALLRSFFSNAVFGLSAGFEGIDRAVARSLRWSRTPPSRFVCSGFVQYGYISAVRRLIKTGRLEAHVLDEVIFKPHLARSADTAAILATTPEDLARSDKLVWHYAIRRGRVHRVASYAAVREIFARR
jgi:hypothetical protein